MTINLTKYDKEQLLKEFEEFLQKKYGKKEGLDIPLSIFSEKLSPFETVVKYLVENEGLGYSKVGSLLQKDRQVIWTTYKRTQKKLKEKFTVTEGQKIPVSRLSSDKHSISELVVAYLKEESGMKNSEIANVLHRDSRTIWTLYSRYTKKQNG